MITVACALPATALYDNSVNDTQSRLPPVLYRQEAILMGMWLASTIFGDDSAYKRALGYSRDQH